MLAWAQKVAWALGLAMNLTLHLFLNSLHWMNMFEFRFETSHGWDLLPAGRIKFGTLAWVPCLLSNVARRK